MIVHFKHPGRDTGLAHCGLPHKNMYSIGREGVECRACLRLLDRDRTMHEARIQLLKDTLRAKRWLREKRA